MRTQIRFAILTWATLLLISLWGHVAAAEGAGSQFGIVYGLSVPDADNTNSYRMSGLKGAAFILPTLSLGGYFLMSDASGQPSSTNQFKYSFHGVEAAYHMPTGSGDTTIAARFGLTKVQVAPETTLSPFHYGIAAGYDYHLLSWASIGFEGSYLHALRGTTTVNGTAVERASFNTISFLVALQFML